MTSDTPWSNTISRFTAHQLSVELIRYYLNRMKTSGWKTPWRNISPPPRSSSQSLCNWNDFSRKRNYYITHLVSRGSHSFLELVLDPFLKREVSSATVFSSSLMRRPFSLYCFCIWRSSASLFTFDLDELEPRPGVLPGGRGGLKPDIFPLDASDSLLDPDCLSFGRLPHRANLFPSLSDCIRVDQNEYVIPTSGGWINSRNKRVAVDADLED